MNDRLCDPRGDVLELDLFDVTGYDVPDGARETSFQKTWLASPRTGQPSPPPAPAPPPAAGYCWTLYGIMVALADGTHQSLGAPTVGDVAPGAFATRLESGLVKPC